MKKENICPVCGFNKLDEKPYDKYDCPSHEICPCCGTEFGYDDKVKDKSRIKRWKELQLEWVRNGYKWFSVDEKPENWNPHKQLDQLKEK